MRLIAALLFSLMAVIAVWSCSGSSSSSKWTLFVNGSIYIDADKKVSNLLVRDGVVVGADINPDEYQNAEIIDLKGAAAYPGFNDSHVHLISMAVSMLQPLIRLAER